MATTPMSIRLDGELWEALCQIAAADDRTTASLIRKVLREYASQQARGPQPEPSAGHLSVNHGQ